MTINLKGRHPALSSLAGFGGRNPNPMAKARWHYIETTHFKRSFKKLPLHRPEAFLAELEAWAVTFDNSHPTAQSSRTVVDEHFEIWVTKWPNREAHKGRNALRLLHYIRLPSGEHCMEYVLPRPEVGFLKEGPRKKNAMAKREKDLHKRLQAEYPGEQGDGGD